MPLLCLLYNVLVLSKNLLNGVNSSYLIGLLINEDG